MQYRFDEMPDRRSTESAKWNHFEPDVIPFWVADMDFVSPEPVVQALQERVAHGVFGYGMTPPDLRQAIVDRMMSLYQWKVAPNEIVPVPGVVTGFNLAGHALLSNHEGVLIQTPVYSPFLGMAKNACCSSHEAELVRKPDGAYAIDWDVFENAIQDNTRMFLLCNPHNPVGRVYTRPELERMAEICIRHNLLICSDEIHCDLLYPGQKHIPIASLDPKISRRCVTLMAPSKTYNIAGLSCSFAIIQDPQLRGQYQKGDEGMVHGVNILGMVAARAAYSQGQEWLDQLLAYLDGNRRMLYDYVNQHMPGVHMAMPEGTYLAWLDCRETGLGDQPADFFLKKARVALGEGAGFGPGGAGFVRLNFGCPRAMLLEGLEKMRKALEEK